ncbi:MAG: carbamoyltransferase HypF [Gammaproteobacteria bacterium]|nr:carbamoyltransferase HypF [Gammaproteobacteria bacterium]
MTARAVTEANATTAQHAATARRALRLSFTGQVQGVGFRPFVYRLAIAHSIVGWVENRVDHVLIYAQGCERDLQQFRQAILSQAVAPIYPQLLAAEEIGAVECTRFSINHNSIPQHAIQPSTAAAPAIHLPADLALCEACRHELNDPQDRRYRYPFINCSQCGPRYSLIRALPYARDNTTMAAFALCAACQAEYDDPANRRFHAEPIACPTCGPQLSYQQGAEEITHPGQALLAAVAALGQGRIVAVKGIGGYHLLCDARSDQAVARLRARKHRPHKPFAVMLAADQLPGQVQVSSAQRQYLAAAAHPILLLEQRTDSTLSPLIAPGLTEIGVLLPYSPLHSLLSQQFGGPLVATSANISGEPVLTRRADVSRRLTEVADAFLHHDRHIQRPVDDPVYRIIRHRARPLRLGRGNAPLELRLPFRLDRPLLAVGGQLKNTLALAWDERIVISPHIGELDTLRSQQVFARTIDDLQDLYQVQAEQLVCDAHPGYASSRWARDCGLPVHPVYHHHAHAAVLCGEFPQPGRWLVFCWDGVGLGEDQSLWGGEALLGRPGHWQRAASFRGFHLPGGDRVGREPWRSAAALSWEAGVDWQSAGLESGLESESALLYQAWKNGLNCPPSSSVGRLFDAAAALTGLLSHSSYEAQGPMWLEALAGQHRQPVEAVALPLQPDDQGLWRTDWSPLLAMLTDDRRDRAARAACFHESLAQALLQQAQQLRDSEAAAQREAFVVGLSGGVFQNRRLTERAMDLLEADGFRCYLPQRVPVNDAGLCYGQVMEYHSATHSAWHSD